MISLWRRGRSVNSLVNKLIVHSNNRITTTIQPVSLLHTTMIKSTVQPDQLKPKSKQQKPVMSWFGAISSILTGCIVVSIIMYKRRERQKEQEKARKQQIGKAAIGGEWELIRQDGKTSGSVDYNGKWYLLYFGFTHCPDVCPDELEKMAKIIDVLDKDSHLPRFEAVFITVDPERDTPAAVKEYLSEFSPRIVGFTGSKEQIQKVCKTFRVYHSEGPRDDDNDYIVDHTIIIYLINPDGDFVDYYGQLKTFDQVVQAIKISVASFDSVYGRTFFKFPWNKSDKV